MTGLSPRVLTSPEVAQLFGVSTHTITEWARTGRLQGFRTPVGRHWRFHRQQVEQAWETLSRKVPPHG
jgi:excisionase family DNA binding protein